MTFPASQTSSALAWGHQGEGLGFGTWVWMRPRWVRGNICQGTACTNTGMQPPKQKPKRAQEKFLKIICPQRESPGKQELFPRQHPLEPAAGISFVHWRQRISAAFCKICFLQEADKPSQAAAILELKAFPLPVGCSELPRRQDLLQTTHSSSHCSRTGIPCKALVTWGVKQEG